MLRKPALRIAQPLKVHGRIRKLKQVLWLREGFKSWELCFSPTHRFVRAETRPQANATHWRTQTETRPKAKTETRPAALNKATRTATGQCRSTTAPNPSLNPQAKSGARPTLRTRPAIKANLVQRRGRRTKATKL